MNIYASAAVTTDGYMDDASPERLIISTPEDFMEVQRLRAACDAILVGAETLRRDNPSLLVRDESLRARRRAEGRPEDIDKVTFTASGRLEPSMNFFTQGAGRKFVFSTRPLPQLAGVAEVIVPEEPLTAQLLVTELEKRGIERLLVEGGPRTLRLFARAGLIDTLRLAVNRSMRLGVEADAPRLCFDEGYLDVPHTDAMLDDRMEIRTWRFHPNTREEDLCLLRRAIELSLQSPPSPTSYRVGAVVRTARGELFTGYTHETSPTHHAEQEAVAKALAAGAELRGAAMYSSMEPCSRRSSEPESCSAMMLRLGFARAVFALYEPDRFVCCRGALNLREGGVDVRAYPSLGGEVLAVNAHLFH